MPKRTGLQHKIQLLRECIGVPADEESTWATDLLPQVAKLADDSSEGGLLKAVLTTFKHVWDASGLNHESVVESLKSLVLEHEVQMKIRLVNECTGTLEAPAWKALADLADLANTSSNHEMLLRLGAVAALENVLAVGDKNDKFSASSALHALGQETVEFKERKEIEEKLEILRNAKAHDGSDDDDDVSGRISELIRFTKQNPAKMEMLVNCGAVAAFQHVWAVGDREHKRMASWGLRALEREAPDEKYEKELAKKVRLLREHSGPTSQGATWDVLAELVSEAANDELYYKLIDAGAIAAFEHIWRVGDEDDRAEAVKGLQHLYLDAPEQTEEDEIKSKITLVRLAEQVYRGLGSSEYSCLAELARLAEDPSNHETLLEHGVVDAFENAWQMDDNQDKEEVRRGVLALRNSAGAHGVTDLEIRDCTVCQEQVAGDDPDRVALQCAPQHVFHGDCIRGWVKRQRENDGAVTCPDCRSEIGVFDMVSMGLL